MQPHQCKECDGDAAAQGVVSSSLKGKEQELIASRN